MNSKQKWTPESLQGSNFIAYGHVTQGGESLRFTLKLDGGRDGVNV